MKGRFMNGFTKITGVIPQAIIFRTKVYYEDKKAQSRNIKGPAIVVSNHTALLPHPSLDGTILIVIGLWQLSSTSSAFGSEPIVAPSSWRTVCGLKKGCAVPKTTSSLPWLCCTPRLCAISVPCFILTCCGKVASPAVTIRNLTMTVGACSKSLLTLSFLCKGSIRQLCTKCWPPTI